MQLKLFIVPVKKVQKKVGSKAALKEIEGIGEARVEKYGDALLKLLRPEVAKPG